MERKPPDIERKLILARDHRRKYGSRLTFQVQTSACIGYLENVTLLLDDGSLAIIRPDEICAWEGGKRYVIDIEGFPTASQAEAAGLKFAQALLLCAVSLDFGLRLSYISHEPASVFDRTVNSGIGVWGEASTAWAQDIVLTELTKSLKKPVKDRRLLLSMELFAAASLESNDRARFVMAVSALEPLAEQKQLGANVSVAVDKLCDHLDADASIQSELRDSLRGRLLQLKRESIRQALKRLSGRWFPAEPLAWEHIDRAYGLRSELLHEGRPADLDILLTEETRRISNYLRRIYEHEYCYALRAAAMI